MTMRIDDGVEDDNDDDDDDDNGDDDYDDDDDDDDYDDDDNDDDGDDNDDGVDDDSTSTGEHCLCQSAFGIGSISTWWRGCALHRGRMHICPKRKRIYRVVSIRHEW